MTNMIDKTPYYVHLAHYLMRAKNQDQALSRRMETIKLTSAKEYNKMRECLCYGMSQEDYLRRDHGKTTNSKV